MTLYQLYLVPGMSRAVFWAVIGLWMLASNNTLRIGGAFVLFFLAVMEADIAHYGARSALRQLEIECSWERIYRPDPEPQTVRMLTQVDLARWQYHTVDPDLKRLAIGLLDGKPFSERAWPGLSNFRQRQDDFERLGLVVLKGNRRILNSRGRRVCLEIKYGHATDLPLPT